MSTFHDRFARLLKARRTAARLSQRVVAERAGVSSEFISRMERGLTLPALDTFVRLCDALNTTPNDLLLDRPYTTAMEALNARIRSSTPEAARTAVHAAEAILAYAAEKHM
ncbi:MAG: helix-turn-helix transcriptional regulator [Myxococcota bacterium]